MFFRAQGDKTEEFRQIQVEDSPKLDTFQTININNENIDNNHIKPEILESDKVQAESIVCSIDDLPKTYFVIHKGESQTNKYGN